MSLHYPLRLQHIYMAFQQVETLFVHGRNLVPNRLVIGQQGLFTFHQPIPGLLGTKFLPWTNKVSTCREPRFVYHSKLTDNVELLRTLLVFAREHRVVPCAGAILVREGEVAATLSVREGTELGAGGNLGYIVIILSQF